MRRGDVIKDIWGSVGVVQTVCVGTSIENHGAIEVLIIKETARKVLVETYEQYGYLEHYCHFNWRKQGTIKIINPARKPRRPFRRGVK